MADKNSLLITINGDAKNFKDEINKVKKQTQDLENTLKATAKASAVAFAGFASSIALTTKSFANYEKALVGVGKTTNIEGKRLADFGKQFQKLSSTIPISTNELLGIAQAAGQLGVSGEKNLLKFTDTVAKLGVATDLSGEEAATALTRILNVTNESIDSIDKFGSVIVALGNNFAATESEIVRVTTEVSRSTSVFGVSAAEAAGLATALKSVGVQAQLGGSAVGRAFRAIDSSIRGGGKALQDLSAITGIASDNLQKAFAEDSTAVFQKFVEGLGRIQGAGGSSAEALKKFGLAGDEILKVLPVLAGSSELLGKALNTAGEEAKNATALNKEAAVAFNTLDSELQRASNNFTTLSTNIGAQLAPAVTQLLTSVNGLITSFNELDEETVSSIATFLKWGAIITGTAATVATFAIGLLKIRQLLSGLRAAFAVGRIAALGFTGALTGGLSLVIGFLPEIIDGVKSIVGYFDKDKEPKSLTAINTELESIDEKIKSIEASGSASVGRDLVDIQALKDQRAELEKLRDAKIQASEDFGTGSLLVRPEADQAGLPSDPFGLEGEQQEIHFAPAAKQDAGEEKLSRLKENLQLEREAINENEALKAEDEAQRREEKAALDEELRALEVEQRDALNEEDLAAAQALVDTQAEAERKFANEKLKSQIAERNKFKQDTLKFGKEIAMINSFYRTEELKGAEQGASQLVKLTQSKNTALKAVGKAASLAQIAIDTPRAAMGAYAALSPIPFVGPALGIAAAAASIAYGAEQAASVASAQTGGFVPPTSASGGARDRTQMLLEPGELVVPRALSPNFVQSVGQPQSGDFANDDASAPTEAGENVIRLEGDLVQNEEFVSALANQLREQQEFDNVRI